MRDFFQVFILNQFVVGFALVVVLGLITRWAIIEQKQYPGYGLGWLISILLLVIYTILFGDRPRPYSNLDLSLFQILFAIVLGLISGFATQFGRLTGRITKTHQPSRRNIALQAALYTTVTLVLLGLVIIESSVVQRMVGIYGLALGVAVLMAIVWSSIDDEQPGQQAPLQQGGAVPPQAAPPQPPPANRYTNPQPNFKDRNHK